jgi:hypothetical protein
MKHDETPKPGEISDRPMIYTDSKGWQTSLAIPVRVLMNLISHTGYLMGLVEALSRQSAYMDDEKLESLTTEHDHIMKELINAL